jgi:hypothetical protein
MNLKTILICLTLSVFMVSAVTAEDSEKSNWLESGLALADESAAKADAPADAPAKEEAPADPADCEGPPLPFHCVEGYSGGAITPLAYICNTRCKFSKCGYPVLATSFFNAGSKEFYALTVTQTFFECVEFGFGYNRLESGSLYDEVHSLGLDMGPRHVDLFHFNLRGMIIKEDSFGLPLPAITAGVHFKYNADVDDINHHLRVPGLAPRGVLTMLGYDSDCGVDFTLSASKTLIEPLFKRPLILTAGLRLTKAAQLGLLGFGDEYNAFFEGSVCYMPFDNIVLGYEIRCKESPYNKFAVPGNGRLIIGEEDNWHAFSVSWIVNENLTISGLYGALGTLVNSTEDKVFGFQVKYEF